MKVEGSLDIVKAIGYSEPGLIKVTKQQAPFTAELLRLRAWQAANPPPTPAPVPTPIPVPIAVSAPIVAPAAPSESEASYKAWIYNEESGNDPTKWNSSGCLGLGQACPAQKLLNVCPNEDYACEDGFFTQYMESRYGTWAAAYNFHIANGWW